MALRARVRGAAAYHVEQDPATPVRSQAYARGRRSLEERDECGPIFWVVVQVHLRIFCGPSQASPRKLKRSLAMENVVGVSATIKKQLRHRDVRRSACRPKISASRVSAGC